MLKQLSILILLIAGLPLQAKTRITTYKGPTRVTASGAPVRRGIIAHTSLPFGTIVSILFKGEKSPRKFVVADRGADWDVYHPHAGPGVLPDYGRTRVISRGHFDRNWTRRQRTSYIAQRLKQAGR